MLADLRSGRYNPNLGGSWENERTPSTPLVGEGEQRTVEIEDFVASSETLDSISRTETTATVKVLSDTQLLLSEQKRANWRILSDVDGYSSYDS